MKSIVTSTTYLCLIILLTLNAVAESAPYADITNKPIDTGINSEVVNVKQFGAIGNGESIDRVPIQSGIDLLHTQYIQTGRTYKLDISNGIYLVDSVKYTSTDDKTIIGATSIVLKDGVILCGDGTIKLTPHAYGSGAFFRIISSTADLKDAAINNLKIDGNSSKQLACTQCGNILLEVSKNVSIENVTSINSNGTSIMLRGTTTSYMTDINIKNNTVDFASNIGIQSSQFSGVLISGNNVSNTANNCIDLYGDDGSIATHAHHFIVENNVCNSSLTGVFLETVSDGQVKNNIIKNASYGFAVNRIHGQPNNIIISENQAENCRYGIRVSGDTGGIKISGNTFNNYKTAGVGLGAGNGNVSHVEIVGNQFTPESSLVPTILITGNVASFVTGNRNKLHYSMGDASFIIQNSAKQSTHINLDYF